MSRRHTELSIAIPSGEPPSEFRIFTSGEVVTTKGTFVFDALAADSVMKEYLAHGIDLMIDYDHASLASLSVDPALSGKAAGWFNLEVRNGELWAVNVRWTQPAADAMRRKEWRFMSPAFQTDDAGRVASVLNVAVTNMPATRRLTPLMAASLMALGASSMGPELVRQALDALIGGDAEKCSEILKGLIAEAAGGEAAEPAAEEAPKDEAPAPEAPAPEAMADAPPVEEDPKKKEDAVAASALLRMTGAVSLSAAVAQTALYRASHIELETERQKLANERAMLESAERRKGCVDLVALGGRAPSTVWADSSASAPKSYLASMPISDFREFVSDAIKASGRAAKPAPKDATAQPVEASGGRTFSTQHGSVTLSAREVSDCESLKVDPAVYAANKAFQIKARGSKE